MNSSLNTRRWLVVVFAAISFIGVLHHEMWRDELIVWNFARDSATLADLWSNMATDPNPMLWHTALWVVAKFTHNPMAMQYVHWLVTVAAVYLFVLHAPFTLWQKVLFCLGYYTLYEYCIIARGYNLGMLLLFLFCWLMQRQPRNLLPLALVVGLMFCSHVFDWPLAIACLAMFIISDSGRRQMRHDWSTTALAGAILAACVLLTGAKMLGYASVPYHFSRPERLTTAMSTVWCGLVPMPIRCPLRWDSNLICFSWNSNLLADDYSAALRMSAVILSIVLIVVFSIYFWRRDGRVFLFYVVGTLLVLALEYAVGGHSARQCGRFWLLFLAAVWLTGENPYRSLSRLITLLLVVHAVAGILCYRDEIRFPFSAAKQTVQFLRDNGFADKPTAVSHDGFAASISGYLGRPVYAADSGRMQSFVLQDDVYYANQNRPINEVLRGARDRLSAATNQMVFITGNSIQPTDGITRLAEFNWTLTDESLNVYLVEAISRRKER